MIITNRKRKGRKSDSKKPEERYIAFATSVPGINIDLYTKSEKLMRLSHILPHLKLYQFHVPQSMKIKTMLKRYAAETDCDTKDRMMLIIRVKRDGITMRDSAKSLGKSASWGYKWHERYLEVGFDRLGNMPRSGRPTKASKADMKKIRKAACSKPVWTGREMQQYIQQKTGVKYELGYVRQILRGWGYSQKVPVGKHARRAPDEEIRKFQKEMPEIIKKRTVKEQS